MYIHVPLILFLLANVAATDASLLARSSDSLVRAATRAHKHAIQRSAGLAKDLRLSFRGLLAVDSQQQQQQQPAAVGNSRVYCVNSAGTGLTGNGTNVIGSGDGTSTVSSGSKPTSAGASSGKGAPTASSASGGGATPTGSPSPQSPWKMAQSYVRIRVTRVLLQSERLFL